MSLNDLLSKIKQDAQDEANEITKKAYLEAAEIKGQAQEKMGKIKETKTARIKKEAQRKIEQAKFQANQMKNNEILASKYDSLVAIIDKLQQELPSLDKNKQKELFTIFAQKIGATNEATILVAPASEAVARDVFVNTTIKTDAKINFGFRLITNKIEWDFTGDTLLQNFRDQHLQELFNKIF